MKRAFGETNLERKCRLLFGVCIGLLIAGAFYWVDQIGEGLVEKTTNQIGRDWGKIAIIHLHWLRWETELDRRELVEKMGEDLLTERFQWAVLSLGRDEFPWQQVPEGKPPASPQERALLEELRTEWEEQMLAVAETTEEGAKAGDASEPEESAEPIFRTLEMPAEDKYCYYQPIDWKPSCRICHAPMASSVLSASEIGLAFDTASPPFRVVKVVIPYGKTRDAVHLTRAILAAGGILTIFVAMVILYVIVRYVIVKPLKHLRDVSDEISRGNTELRAEIRTNDEFQELADAFNRMLRHLIEAHAELRHANETLDAKVDELAQLSMRLYEMNRLKSDFLANMSHELRTPLNSIIGFSEVLQGVDSLTEKQKRYARNIQKSGRILLEMINDILDLAKLEAGKMEVRPAEFRIDAVIAGQCDMVRSLTEEKNIDLEVQVPEDEPRVYQDQAKVQQILTNLLSNAIKFTPEGGRITVAAARSGSNRLVITVADTGVGIPEEDREAVFEKFRQSRAVLGDDGLTREHSGTGLGLSIVRELSKLLGGEVTFESELGRGSTFFVALPWRLTERPRFSTEVDQKLDGFSHLTREDLRGDAGSETTPVTHGAQ